MFRANRLLKLASGAEKLLSVEKEAIDESRQAVLELRRKVKAKLDETLSKEEAEKTDWTLGADSIAKANLPQPIKYMLHTVQDNLHSTRNRKMCEV